MEDERTFLHEIASPLTAAMYIAHSLIDQLEMESAKEAPKLQQVIQIQKSLDKLMIAIKDRRQSLSERELK